MRGDHELNEIKAAKIPGLANYRFANEAEIVEWFGTPPGYLGPIDPKKPIKVVADRTVANMSDFVCGANEVDFHYTGVNWGRDLPSRMVFDIRNVVAGDPSPDGQGRAGDPARHRSRARVPARHRAIRKTWAPPIWTRTASRN